MMSVTSRIKALEGEVVAEEMAGLLKELEAENDELWHKLALARRRVAMQAMVEIKKRWQLAAKAAGFRRWLGVGSGSTALRTDWSTQSTASIACIQGLRHIISVWGKMSMRLWFGKWAMVALMQRALASAKGEAVAAKQSMLAAKERLKATFDFGASEPRSEGSPSVPR